MCNYIVACDILSIYPQLLVKSYKVYILTPKVIMNQTPSCLLDPMDETFVNTSMNTYGCIKENEYSLELKD